MNFKKKKKKKDLHNNQNVTRSSYFSFHKSLFIIGQNCSIGLYGARKYSEIIKNQSSHDSKQSFGSSLRSLHQAGLRKEGCRGKVCQLLLAEGLDLQVLGKKYAADLEYIVCVVLGAFPRVLTGSWDDSIHRH